MKWFLFNSFSMLVCMLVLHSGSAGAEDPEKKASPLMDPNCAEMTQKAPDVYKAKFETSAGDFVIEVKRSWAPIGADRFYNLVNNGFYDDCRFFRIIASFMAQIGINGDPKVSAIWRGAQIKDDPVIRSNTRGYVSFATGGPNTRTTQFFINFKDNARLDQSGFSPFGKVVEGMSVVDDLYSGYGEGAPRGSGPAQGKIQSEGNAYLIKEFTKLDYVKKASILEEKAPEKK
ncbi:peptidylprolyl isomerase [Candidatus Eisenbacteria bacterium]|uniref:Peptidyl-prolyl cis-trans isomerase n=1 Tax=Eiseniibacteriota bacterium TaxID=2212470 RepID=A0ABV6YJ68_UNCEI